MNTEKMLKLATVLDDVAPQNFTMWVWSKMGGVAPKCGFAGCAVGWAVHSKQFPGLEFFTNHLDVLDIKYADETGGVFHNFEAVARCFDLPSDFRNHDVGYDAEDYHPEIGSAQYFFHPEGYPRDPEPVQVAKRIRDAVEKYMADHPV